MATWTRAAWMVVAICGAAWIFRNARVESLLTSVAGPSLAFILLPQFLALASEAVAWRWTFVALSQSAGFWQLLRVRLQTEALAQTLPAGVVFSESIKPYLLGRHCGIPLERAIAGVAARKYLLLLSQAVYIVICAVLGFDALRRTSLEVVGGSGLEWFVPAFGIGIAAAALGLCAILRRGRLATRVLGFLERLPVLRLRNALGRSARRFHQTDTELRRFFGHGPTRLFAPGLGFLCAWLLESLETYLILTLLGADLDFATVAGLEVALSLLRNVVFVLPAGLGLQDVGYLVFLRALGISDALDVAAAFSLLKRGKEMFWAGAGYGLLAWDSRGRSHQLVWTP